MCIFTYVCVSKYNVSLCKVTWPFGTQQPISVFFPGKIMALPGCTILRAGLRHHGLCTTQFGMSTGVMLVHLMFRWPCCWGFGDVASDITKRHSLTANSPSSGSYDISTWDRLTCIVKLSPLPSPHIRLNKSDGKALYSWLCGFFS